jgi:hypothetical protein
LEKIDLILKFYNKDEFVKIRNYDNCIIGIDVQSKRLIYSVSLFIETLKNKMEESDAIDYFYDNIYLKNIQVNNIIFCEDFFFYDKY